MCVVRKEMILFRSICMVIMLYTMMWAQALRADDIGSAGDMSSNGPVSGTEVNQVLTLERAENAAVEDDPVRVEYQARVQALYEQATADGQLPDPTIKLGLSNFPTDTFSRSQEPMTQIQIGVQQAFPPGETLALRKQQGSAMAEAMQSGVELQRLMALRSIREAWLDVYYWHAATGIVRDSHNLFAQLSAITQSQYATGRRNQQDVLSAELELGVLKDREINYRTEEIRARATLSRWVGDDEGQWKLPELLPEMPTLANADMMASRIDRHPIMQVTQARIKAQEDAVAIAKQAYKPRWTLDVNYGSRIGYNGDGSPRADLVSGMVSMSVPIFTADRQDRRVAASRSLLQAEQDARELQRRQLQQDLKTSEAQWRLLGQRIQQYQNVLLPQAGQTAQAALHAYQSDVGDFALLMRARINELEMRLKFLKLRVDRARAHSSLLYLAGETK